VYIEQLSLSKDVWWCIKELKKKMNRVKDVPFLSGTAFAFSLVKEAFLSGTSSSVGIKRA